MILICDTVKILDWGEDGYATEAETVALRASFKQEVAVWHKLDHPNVTKACLSVFFNGTKATPLCSLLSRTN